MSAPGALMREPERRSLRAWLANPWAETRFLWIVGIAYVAWTLLPVAEAVLFSRSGRGSRSAGTSPIRPDRSCTTRRSSTR